MGRELLRVENLKKYFDTKEGSLHAVDDVSFTLDESNTLGVVGESGCGKSTLGRTLLGLIKPTSGKILYYGEDISNAKARRRHELRQDMQIVFQDPFSSLNPRYCLFEQIADPLRTYKIHSSKAELERHVFDLMDTVGLARRFAYTYPHELDGGRRQRISIARALALEPRFIVCDEPVSSLDVSIQAQILNLLQDLQEERQLAYVFVTHDLSVVKHISDDILVMYMGCMVEMCQSDTLFEKTYHPYTKGLLSAIPLPVVREREKRDFMRGELTSPVNPKPGCRFANRCPYAEDICRCEMPRYEEIEPGHFVACHRVREINAHDGSGAVE